MTAKVGSLGGGGIEQKGKRTYGHWTYGHRQWCSDCRDEELIRGLNSNGKYN